MLYLNPTRLTRFLRCEYDWYCYAVLGVVPRRGRSTEALDRGKTLHALFEYALLHYATAGEVFTFAGDVGHAAAEEVYQELYDAESVSLDEQASHEVLDAARYHLARLNLHEWEILTINGEPAIELELKAPVPDGPEDVQLQAIVDVVFRHRASGLVWLPDWKTTKPAIDKAGLLPYVEHNYQLYIQREILRHHGVNVDVSALVHPRSVAPHPPTITSQGKVSRDKSKLACDWPTFRQALIDNGEDPESAAALAVQEHLRTATFIRWRLDVTSPGGEKSMAEQVRVAAQRMSDLAAGRAVPIRNLRDTTGKAFKGCSTCDYASWCTASMRGVDVLPLLGTDYKPKPDSPLVGQQVYTAAPFDASAAYVQRVAELGRTIESTEEFRP